jgi:hypothetical protein
VLSITYKAKISVIQQYLLQKLRLLENILLSPPHPTNITLSIFDKYSEIMRSKSLVFILILSS